VDVEIAVEALNDQGWTSTNRTTTQPTAMVKLRGATKFFMVLLLPLQ
jgi:hypothetical protein